jgi:23S rRNA (adenine2503-C2)-methyltransferase
MDELKGVLREFCKAHNESIFVQYVLIKDVNDAEEHAQQLADYLEGLRVKVNLLPINRLPGSEFAPPSESAIEQFRNRLAEKKIWVRLRTSKGQNIMAACGQLAS